MRGEQGGVGDRQIVIAIDSNKSAAENIVKVVYELTHEIEHIYDVVKLGGRTLPTLASEARAAYRTSNVMRALNLPVAALMNQRDTFRRIAEMPDTTIRFLDSNDITGDKASKADSCPS